MSYTRQYGGPNGYGHKSDNGWKATPFRHLRAKMGLPTLPPPSIDLESFILDKGSGLLVQGNTSSCTGHAVVGSVTNHILLTQGPDAIPDPYSPTGVYGLGRRIDQSPTIPLQDEGAQPNEVMRACTEFGLPTRSWWGKDTVDADGNIIPDAAQINDEPPIGGLESASAFELVGQYALTSTGDEVVLDLLSATAAGFFPPFAVLVDRTFEMYTGGALSAPDLNGILGGHYVYACGYTWDGSNVGTAKIKFANHWTKRWGMNGFGWGDINFIHGTSDAYVMNVRRKAP